MLFFQGKKPRGGTRYSSALWPSSQWLVILKIVPATPELDGNRSGQQLNVKIIIGVIVNGEDNFRFLQQPNASIGIEKVGRAGRDGRIGVNDRPTIAVRRAGRTIESGIHVHV